MRGLKVAVVVMGVLLIVGTTTLVVLLALRAGGANPASPNAAAPNVVANVLLEEPAGTSIAGVSALPDRLAVQLHGGGPDRVVVVDLRLGRAVARIGLAQ